LHDLNENKSIYFLYSVGVVRDRREGGWGQFNTEILKVKNLNSEQNISKNNMKICISFNYLILA
jgi:hypothetical protein